MSACLQKDRMMHASWPLGNTKLHASVCANVFVRLLSAVPAAAVNSESVDQEPTEPGAGSPTWLELLTPTIDVRDLSPLHKPAPGSLGSSTHTHFHYHIGAVHCSLLCIMLHRMFYHLRHSVIVSCLQQSK